MLADDILAAAGSTNDRLFLGAFTALGERVKAAQRIDLAPEVMNSALTIMESAIGPQLRALALCRLPFRSTWFEWPATFSGRPPHKRPDDAPVPKRMGALIEVDASFQRGSITYAWAHADNRPDLGGVNLCPLVAMFDWREHGEPLPDLTRAATWHTTATDQDWADLRANFPRVARSTRDDVVAENQRFGLAWNPLMRTFLAMASEGPLFKRFIDAAMDDIEGEPTLTRAAILLLNSKNLTRAEARPVSAKLNAARAKRGRAPLLDHTHVGIRLSRALAARATDAAWGHAGRGPNRAHLVRGHFKIRASGVYWWSPHARGTITATPIRQQYRHVMA